MTECPYIDMLERVANERANAQETLEAIDHISREGCEKCGRILKFFNTEHLKKLAGDKLFSSCDEFMDQKKDYSSILRRSIKPRSKKPRADTNRQQ